MMSQAIPSLDQLQVMLAVVEAGSFSGAARRLNRAQSAITYAVQRLEEQLGTPLFDRTSYRPSLTEAGRILLPRARLIAEEMQALADHARGIAAGLEPELTLVVDAMFPMCALLEALRTFGNRFPSVSPRLYVESMGAATEMVLSGTCTIGLLVAFSAAFEPLHRRPLAEVTLIPVAAPSHPLGQFDGPVPRDELRRHVQLVLSDRSGLTGNRDYGVWSAQTWRLADLGAKHAMLKAGLGWGSMPAHLVADDLAAGRLRRVVIAAEGGDEEVSLPLCAAYRRDRPPGPAGRWLFDHVSETMEINPPVHRLEGAAQ
ncbi:LysR family transcriptional regulator [Aliidongia dinghuensis]|uniref:LysR family transcriptional regulator n=1 Tax=Aliidongia dinghuensis TaxID=1867774 RepID=A0A8J2YP09_9PROT|nr:LysR family transcriptional regulator [Aliidongia dinghuensis]GGF02309.1 LysR family transcriptional regulator [Aliidongia dinghuensis]